VLEEPVCLLRIYNANRYRRLDGHEMKILIRFEKGSGTIHAYELVKYTLFTRTDADEPGMRVVLHEEQRERFNAGSLL
jgi:hypothetical protein